MFQLINDRSAKAFSFTAALSAALIICLIVFSLFKEALPAFSDIGVLRFFSDASWHPEVKADDGLFFILPMVVGTFCVTSLALLFAVPLGVLAAIFSEIYSPKILNTVFKRVLELMAGIPSVVLGLWGLVVLVPIVQKIDGHGASILAGGIVLGVMILPTIALNSQGVFSFLIKEHQEQAEALGLSRGSFVFDILLPLASRGIGLGILLGAARAIGETMVVLMLCGNIAAFPSSVFDPARTLTATIALEMGYSFGGHRGALFFIGLFLMFIVAFLLSLIILLKSSSQNASQSSNEKVI